MAERKKTVDKLISMFDITFKVIGEKDGKEISDQELRSAEFKDVLKRFSLTYHEVTEAYRMASEAQLRDHNGEIINFFPTLSTTQGAKILTAYTQYKIDHPDHSKGFTRLQELIKKTKDEDEVYKKNQRKLEFIKVANAVMKGLVTHDACKFFDDVVKKGGLQDFTPEKQKTMLEDRIRQIYTTEAEKAGSYLLSKDEADYLKAFFAKETTEIDARGQEAFNRIYNIAVAQIKNELVSNWIRENQELIFKQRL